MPESVLTTKRLVLRPVTTTDAPALAAAANHEAVAATTTRIPYPCTVADAEQYIRKVTARTGDRAERFFAITLDGRIVGGIGIEVNPRHHWAEMGAWLTPAHWGKGIITEATREAIRYGFEELGLNRLYAMRFAENEASGRVLEKAGLRREGVLRQHFFKWGRYHDAVCYGILRSEYDSGAE